MKIEELKGKELETLCKKNKVKSDWGGFGSGLIPSQDGLGITASGDHSDG
jgi:hypothetical protein